MKRLLTPTIILVVMIILIILGNIFKPDEEYYVGFASKLVALYKDDKVSTKGIKKSDLPAFEDFKEMLEGKSERLDITRFFTKNKRYYVNESNTVGVIYSSGKCLIDKDYLKLDPSYFSDHEEVSQRVVCNKYYTYLYETNLPSYETILEDPSYDFILESYYATDEGYKFKYKSVYDARTINILLTLDDEVISQAIVEY